MKKPLRIALVPAHTVVQLGARVTGSILAVPPTVAKESVIIDFPRTDTSELANLPLATRRRVVNGINKIIFKP